VKHPPLPHARMRLFVSAFVWSILASLAVASVETPPAYLRQALARFHSDAPRGWAYTLTTQRGNDTSVERYDPSRPKGGEWSLLRNNDREPTADELQRYLRYKASNAPSTSRASFEKGDIDPHSFELLREDDTRAVFRGRLRKDTQEPLLTHVILELTVLKTEARIEEAKLQLAEPFSPALGVRMQELVLTMSFQEAPEGSETLPRTAHSRFRGRMFFLVPIEEELRIIYSDFERVGSKQP